MNTKQKLTQVLINEKSKMENFGRSVEDHELAIKYLQTGEKPSSVDEDRHDILWTAINDYETLVSDYSSLFDAIEKDPLLIDREKTELALIERLTQFQVSQNHTNKWGVIDTSKHNALYIFQHESKDVVLAWIRDNQVAHLMKELSF